MLDLVQRIASRSVNPSLFIVGMSIVYFTGLILLLAAMLKFIEHAAKPHKIVRKKTHPFSTREMVICIVALFPFWLNSIGQMKMDLALQYLSFATGSVLMIFSVAWHLYAKMNIRTMWSDGIEIKQDHKLISTGAYALARHPMYASLLLWCWSSSFMLLNWITLLIITVVILPLMIARARAEERELAKVLPDYITYQDKVHMLALTLRGSGGVCVRILAIALFAYLLWTGLTFPGVVLLFAAHLYLGYSLTPERVAFSYRSKSGMIVVIWGLSLAWHPIYYLLYLVLAMFLYGLRFSCPCMLVYDKYNRCPCFDLAKKCILKKPRE
jgi:protein-S-isoprenylcysteine O-methyltransferase Ste14